MSYVRRLAACAVAAFLAGCSGDSPGRYPVSGTVTFDGKPVAQGDIQMMFVDGMGRPEAARIVDGKYAMDVAPGVKTVAIYATRDSGRKEPGAQPGEMVPVFEQYLPAKFNTTTTLQVEVKATSQNELNFDLTK
ncbi:MAG TPA: hypothetical protein VM452_08120 [Caulifigura sp.]|jgi:hypothetical protein|nr:hypothetical protein [Caulifigura sp.]